MRAVCAIAIVLAACSGGATHESSAQEPTADSKPTAEQVLARFAEVTGGLEARRAIKSAVEVGRIQSSEPGQSAKFVRTLSGDKALLEFAYEDGGTVRLGSDGEVVWLIARDGEAVILDGDSRAAFLKTNDPMASIDWRRRYKVASVRGVEPIEGKPTTVVEMKTFKGRVELHYFDVVSGLLVRRDTPKGTERFSQYKERGGVLFATRVQFRAGETVETTIYDSLELNIAVDPATFAIPEAVERALSQSAEAGSSSN